MRSEDSGQKSNLRNPSIAIVGAGMTGLLWAIKLQEAGIKGVSILEKKGDVGGTWRENTYPGVACDVPSHLYVYSFEPNPEWSSRLAPGHEIFDYYKRVSDKYGLSDKIRFNEEVTDASYKEGKWLLKTSQNKSLTVDFVINCTGFLHQPVLPTINGMKSFKGHLFHTAQWDHNVDLKGKRIGVIGTGSTAAQVIPQLINTEGTTVSVFQRTAQWMLPLPNRHYSEKSKSRLRGNYLLSSFFYRFYAFVFSNTFSRAVIGQKWPLALIKFSVKRHLEKGIKDPDLKAKLTPNYSVGCKRLINSSDFYPAIQKDNAHLISEGIEKITPDGIITEDKKQHDLDIIVLATGFNSFAFMRPMKLTGRDGLDINDAWQNKITAYRSVLMPQYPNYFLMLGPNTPVGNNSVIAMSEVQTNYLMQIIQKWREGVFDTVEPKPEAVDAFMAHIKKGMPKTVWVTGCQSWYLDADGDPALWPYTWQQWLKEMAEPNYSDLVMDKLA